MKGIILFAVSLAGSVALGLAIYLGAFKDVKLADETYGPIQLVAKPHVGAYHKIVPVIEEVEKWARANGEACHLSFGEYLDEVETVPEDRLKSNAGCFVEKDWSAGLPDGFTYREIPKRRYVTAEFEGAPSIGPIKVYPKANEFIESKGLENDGPVMEVYEILPEQKVRTKYFFPVRERS